MSLGKFNLKSYAKINLGLQVLEKRKDNYHNLNSIFQTINLFDEIDIEVFEGKGFDIKSDCKELDWNKNSSVKKIFDLWEDKKGIQNKFNIYIKKNIPLGGGLGGGSSNAAVILMFLNRIYGDVLSREELITIAKQVGADVPYFLYGGSAVIEGIGDIITPIDDLEESFVALVTSPINISTKDVFSRLVLTKHHRKSKIDFNKQAGDFIKAKNDLEEISFKLYPDLKEIKKSLKDLGCYYSLMSGSGSTIYGLYRDESLGGVIKEKVSNVKLVGFVNRKDYIDNIGVSPSGKASVFGADIRRFESSHPRS